MNSLRFGTAVSALALTTMLAGCAAPSFKSASHVNSAKSNMAYGLRAQMALESGDFTTATEARSTAAIPAKLAGSPEHTLWRVAVASLVQADRKSVV